METQVANKVTLYYHTMNFTEVYQPRYYVQYHGDVHDLSMSIYEDFLTPRSKIKGQEKSLLDRYNVDLKPSNLTEETFFANLCKVSVTRKLIDYSRKDHYQFSSLDALMDEFGDLCCPIADEDYQESVSEIKQRLQDFHDAFQGLTPQERIKFRKAYEQIEVKDSVYQDFFNSLLHKAQSVPVNCKDNFGRDINLYIQSVTEKSIVWYDPLHCQFCVSDLYGQFRTAGYKNYYMSRAVANELPKEPMVYFKKDEVSDLIF